MRASPLGLLRILFVLAACALAGCQTASMLSLPGVGASDSAEDILGTVRSSRGLGRLSPDPRLEAAAREQADLMAGSRRMEHTAARGQDFVTRVRRAGIEGAAAENIARGRYDLDDLFLAWMNSRGHRRNMLDPRFTRFGLASAENGKDGQRYWALVLAR